MNERLKKIKKELLLAKDIDDFYKIEKPFNLSFEEIMELNSDKELWEYKESLHGGDFNVVE